MKGGTKERSKENICENFRSIRASFSSFVISKIYQINHDDAIETQHLIRSTKLKTRLMLLN